MEINKHEGLTPLQQFRYELLQWCGKTEDAAKAYQAVRVEAHSHTNKTGFMTARVKARL